MSTLKVNSIEPASAGSENYFLVRAWVTLNSSGTVTILGDGNISSLTDNGVGLITANFSNSMSSANYCQTHSGAALNSDTSTLRGSETVYDQKFTSSMRTSYQNGINATRYDASDVGMQVVI